MEGSVEIKHPSRWYQKRATWSFLFALALFAFILLTYNIGAAAAVALAFFAGVASGTFSVKSSLARSSPKISPMGETPGS
jgi:uncharacterized integral membrane protein